MQPSTVQLKNKHLSLLLPLIMAVMVCAGSVPNVFASIADAPAPIKKEALLGAQNRIAVYQGQYWDEEIGLCYNRHRYFDPQICSFISQDPLGLAAGENVYAYAPNVWGWIDPLGLCPKSASKKPDPNILSGHGGLEVGNSSPITIVPEGTSVTVWTEHGNGIYDHLGNSIELKKPITYEIHGNDLVGAKTYLPGSVMPDYTLHPPYNPDLKIMGNPTTVTKPTRLSELVEPGMGNVNWAACLVVEKI